MLKKKVPKVKHISKDFYAVEETGWLPVNKSGFVLLEDDNVTRGTIHGDWPYYQHNGVLVHRAVALTFLKCPGDPKHYQVNHEDGDKLNNFWKNLKWVTVSENAIHAYKNGLRNDNRPLLLKNIESGEITRHYSLQECARFLNVNGSLIHLYLKNDKDPKQPWRNKWSIIYEGNDWPTIDPNLSTGYQKEVIAVPLDKSKQKIIFSSLSDAAKYFNVNRATLGWYVNRLSSNKSNLYINYQWFYLKEYFHNIKDAKKIKSMFKRKNNLKKRHPKKVKVTDLNTGDVELFDSLWTLSDLMGIKKNSLEKAIWRNNGTFQNKIYEYV